MMQMVNVSDDEKAIKMVLAEQIANKKLSKTIAKS